ncbi:ataxin-10 [Anaeramoeba flamelloides]|uniref:Ataxin-10 n=1 Tax=Anaeramoeba flamelloides TaxID=1746091 RepID=A0AAV7ZJK7_9EUKA|nr:ataxin-10 [Anaeramoeba flamelloides]
MDLDLIMKKTCSEKGREEVFQNGELIQVTKRLNTSLTSKLSEIPSKLFRIIRNSCVNMTENQDLLRKQLDLKLLLSIFRTALLENSKVKTNLYFVLQFIANYIVQNKANQTQVWKRFFPDLFNEVLATRNMKYSNVTLAIIYTSILGDSTKKKQLLENHSLLTNMFSNQNVQNDNILHWLTLVLNTIFQEVFGLQTLFQTISKNFAKENTEKKIKEKNVKEKIIKTKEIQSEKEIIKGKEREKGNEKENEKEKEKETQKETQKEKEKDPQLAFKSMKFIILELIDGLISKNEEPLVFSTQQILFLAKEVRRMLEELIELIGKFRKQTEKIKDKDQQLFQNFSVLFRIVSFLIALNHETDLSQLIDKETDLIALVITFLKICKIKKSTNPNFSFFGLEKEAIIVLANMAFRNKIVQDKIRKLEGIEVILNNSKIDMKQPFLREWCLFAIRNLCEGNEENRKYIASFDVKGVSNIDEINKMGLQAKLIDGKLQIAKNPKKK